MTIKTVLVHVHAGPGCEGRIGLAMRISDIFGATLIGLGAEAFETGLMTGEPLFDSASIQAAMDRLEADLPAAEQRFRKVTEGRPDTEWMAATGYPDKLLALHARGADLIVAGRPSRDEGRGYAAKLADLVLEAGAPVLVAGDHLSEFTGQRIVIGWKDTRESRRAVTDALPFLKRAQKVVILGVHEAAEQAAVQAGLNEVSRRLARHGVAAVTEFISDAGAAVADVLQDAANRHAADLIVAGAYARSRAREWLLGGATEDLIATSSRFVLFSH